MRIDKTDVRTPTKTIKTCLKFSDGMIGGEAGMLGFVTKRKNPSGRGSWRGCRADDDCKKKIVIPDISLRGAILPNVLYTCSLIPMSNDNGFIAKTAKLIKFKGKIETVKEGGGYKIFVKFGNKTVVYDPSSKKANENNMISIAKMLRERIDLENADMVAEEFMDSAYYIRYNS